MTEGKLYTHRILDAISQCNTYPKVLLKLNIDRCHAQQNFKQLEEEALN